MSIFKTQSKIDELELYQDLVERFAEYLDVERKWLGDQYYKKPKNIKELEERIEQDIKLNLLKKHGSLWDSFDGNPLCYSNSHSRWETKYNKLSYKHPWKE